MQYYVLVYSLSLSKQFLIASINIKQLQKLLLLIFQPNKQTHPKQQILNLILLIMKNDTLILQICFENQHFNYMSLFGFLQHQHVDNQMLVLFQDLVLPYIRKNPNQIMNILVIDQQLRQLICSQIYQKPIFKIMYTLVFCLSKKQSQAYDQEISQIIYQILQTPFKYFKKLEKKSLVKPKISKKQRNSRGSSIRNSKRKKTRIRGSPSNSILTNSRQSRLTGIKKKVSNCIQMVNFRNNYYRESNYSEQKHLSYRQSLYQTQISPQKSAKKRMKTPHLIQKQQKQTHFVQQIDCSDLSTNLRQLFLDLSTNIQAVCYCNVINFITNFTPQYLNRLLNNCQKYCHHQQYQGYCQGILLIIHSIVKFYQTVRKIQLPQTSQNLQLLQILIFKLEKILKFIILKINFFLTYILQNNQLYLDISTGQKLKKVGIIKFRSIQLINKLLRVYQKNQTIRNEIQTLNNEIQEIQTIANLKQNNKQPINSINSIKSINQIDSIKPIKRNQQQNNKIQLKGINISDLFQIVQKYINSAKWNNLIQTQLIKLTKFIFKLDYIGFKKTYLDIEDPQNSFFGLLIQSFRNKKFVFLKNMKLTNHGNVYFIYQLSRIIVTQVTNYNDMDLLIGKLPLLDTFIKQDLSIFEKSQQISQYFDETKHIEPSQHVINCMVPPQPQRLRISTESLETIQQMVQNLDTHRWSTLIDSSHEIQLNRPTEQSLDDKSTNQSLSINQMFLGNQAH